MTEKSPEFIQDTSTQNEKAREIPSLKKKKTYERNSPLNKSYVTLQSHRAGGRVGVREWSRGRVSERIGRLSKRDSQGEFLRRAREIKNKQQPRILRKKKCPYPQ